MAFIKEKLTKEQQEEVNSWEIKYPLFYAGHIVDEMGLEDPRYWTADRERRIYLFGVYYDRFHFDEKVFVFIWNQKSYIVQFNLSYEDENTAVWSEPKNYLIDSAFPYCEEKQFLDDLREALITYGTSNVLYDSDEKSTVKCNF